MTSCLYAVGLTTLLAIAAITETTQKYCDLKRCHHRNHTLCLYSMHQTSENCGNITSANLTVDEVQQLLEFHNEKSESKALTWDNELADIAQTWADQCDPRTDECRSVDRFFVSQSYGYAKSTKDFISNLTTMVNLRQLTTKTTHVGCGAVRYNADGKWNTTYLVCNYASDKHSGADNSSTTTTPAG